MTERQKKAVALLAVLIFILFSIFVGIYIGRPMILMAKEPAQFQAMVDGYGIWSRLIFIGMVVLQVFVAFIPGEPVELLAGYAFGFLEGTLLCLAGFIIGSWLVFVLVRKLGVKLVEVFFSRENIQQFSFLHHAKKTRVIAFLLMLIPGTPKDFLSYFAGLTSLTLKTWLLIVAVGRLPSLITSTATGAAAGKENYLLSAVMLGITVVITLAGMLYFRRLSKQQNSDTTVSQK